MLSDGALAGQIAVVTGGGTGLGRAIAVELARAGAAVAVASRQAEHRKAGVEAVEALGAEAVGVELDVRNPEAVASAFDEVTERLGLPTVLVNNAAGNFPVPAEDLSPNGWRAVVSSVLDGTFYCSSEFARRRIAAGGGGAILNIAATTAWTGGPGTVHSSAAKAGVVNLTQSLAVEWAHHGIRVNAIAPGRFPHAKVLDQMRGGAAKDDGAATVPAGRVGRPHELGWAAVFMCSPFAAYLTGHTLVLDGANWLRRGIAMPEFVPVRDQLDAVIRQP
jgi:NAD(P)-dependent dehydrogenase (short-subunit alcohol dehydrogenase family)